MAMVYAMLFFLGSISDAAVSVSPVVLLICVDPCNAIHALTANQEKLATFR